MTEPAPLAGRIVLVVEDEYLLADEIRRTLAMRGAEVLGPVGRVPDALAVVANAARIDAAVLDVNLHDVMVFQVADALRDRGVPFVFTTGYERSNIPASYAQVRCFEKPIEPATIAQALLG